MANRDIDDVYKRIGSKNSYRDQRFNEKQSIKDDYTGGVIYRSSKKHAPNKSADVDHITPIHKVQERYGDLTIEQQKKLANNEHYNYALTNSSLNRKKGGRDNHEYLADKTVEAIKKVADQDLKGAKVTFNEVVDEAPGMLLKEVKSRAGMAAEGNLLRVENAGDKALKGAKDSLSAAALPLMILSVQNLCEVSSGQKTMEEAGKEVGAATLEVAVTGGGMELVAEALSEGAEVMGSSLLKQASQNMGGVAQVVSVSIVVLKSFTKWVNNEISGEDFFYELSKDGLSAVSSMIGSVAASGWVSTILPASMMAGPAGLAVGAAAIVGGMVASTVCVGIYQCVQNIKKKYSEQIKMYEKKIARLNRVMDQAITEIQHQQEILKEMMLKEYQEWDIRVNRGFKELISAMLSNDFEGTSKGIGNILEVLGAEVMFKNMEEFDEFFFDNNAILTL